MPTVIIKTINVPTVIIKNNVNNVPTVIIKNNVSTFAY